MKDETPRVRLTHPGGVPLPFSESLLNYQMSLDDRREDFSTGDWLQTLDTGELRDVLQGLERFCEGSREPSMDDMLCLVLQAMKGELGSDVVEFPSPEEIMERAAAFLYIAGMEANRRQGFITLFGKLRLYPEPGDSFEVTDLAKAQVEQWKRELN